MSLLSYEQRQYYWEWCRRFIDKEAIYRTDENNPPIAGLGGDVNKGLYTWQGYLRRACYNPTFADRLGLLFWDHFQPIYESKPFQICAPHASGVPIGMIISTMARRLGIPLNVFLARREPKQIGTDNWFDGVAYADTPVLLVDDVAASTTQMLAASGRIQVKLRLPLHRNYFAINNKVGGRFHKRSQHTESYLNNELVALYTMNNFCRTAEEFIERYGHSQKWTGPIK